MSKKNKRPIHKKKFPWPVVIIGGILLIVAVLFLANQGSVGGGTSSIAVDQQKIDYGDVKFDTPKFFAIKVINTGDGVLRFKEAPYIEVVEGC